MGQTPVWDMAYAWEPGEAQQLRGRGRPACSGRALNARQATA